MSSAFLSPIGKCPIDPEGPDEELDADHVHKECKECYKCWGNGKSIQISSKVPWKIKRGDFKGEEPTNIWKPRHGGKCPQGSK